MTIRNRMVIASLASAKRKRKRSHTALPGTRGSVIAAAMDDYLQFLEGDGAHILKQSAMQKSGQGIHSIQARRCRGHCIDGRQASALARRPVNTAPRLRTERAKNKNSVPLPARMRNERADHLGQPHWTLLRAALNYAFQNGKAASDIAWRRTTRSKTSTRRDCDT